MNSPREGITFVLSAPSGTGKTTVCKALREKIPALKFSVSHTTRSPRPEEKEGEAYYFISRSREKKMGKVIDEIKNDFNGVKAIVGSIEDVQKTL